MVQCKGCRGLFPSEGMFTFATCIGCAFPTFKQKKEEKVEGRRFWLVWCPSASNPSCRHGSRELAQAEAVRLARSNSGKEFFVAEVIERVCVEIPQPTIEHLK